MTNLKIASGLTACLMSCALFCIHPVYAADEKDEIPLLVGEKAFLQNIKNLQVSVEDEVDGGCMPLPDSVKTVTAAALIRNGFVISEEAFSPSFVIYALGYLTAAGCAVHVHSTVFIPILVAIPFTDNTQTLIFHRFTVGGVLLTGSKNDMQKRIQDVAAESADKLLIMVTRAANEMESKNPALTKTIRTNMKQFATESND